MVPRQDYALRLASYGGARATKRKADRFLVRNRFYIEYVYANRVCHNYRQL